jgi:hypothetical protein
MSDKNESAETAKVEFKQLSAKVPVEVWRAFRFEAVNKDTKVSILAGKILADAAAKFE